MRQESPGQYMGEGEIVTWFSFFQFILISVICFGQFWLRRQHLKTIKSNLRGTFVWLLMGFGFAFFAVDEVERFHERLDYLLHDLFQLQETLITDKFDDMIVGLYILMGLGVLYLFRVELSHYRRSWPLFYLGLILAMISITLDVLGGDGHTPLLLWLQVAEDSFKVFTQGALLGWITSCFVLTYQERLS